MKAPTNSIATKLSHISKIGALALALLAASTIAARADIHWIGGTADYTNAADWAGGVVPGPSDNAINDNGTNNVVQINAGDGDWTVNDFRAGDANGAEGAYVQNAQNATINGWFRMGDGSPSLGIYTLNGGTINMPNGGNFNLGESTGTGVLNINGGTINVENARYGLGDSGSTGCTGVVNQVAGTVGCNGQTYIGNNFGVGFYNLSGGTVNLSNWVCIARNGGGGGAQGTVNMTGGTMNVNAGANGGNFFVGDGGNAGAVLNQSGGTINVTSGQYMLPLGGGNNQPIATNNISGTAALIVNNWLAVGRAGGSGTMNLSGGSVTKTGTTGDHFTVGSGGTGILNQSGGAITNLISDFYLGETASGTWNLSGGTALLNNLLIAAQSSGTGTLNLNGGTLTAAQVTTGNATGVSILNLNGGTLQASGNNPTFLYNLTLAFVGSPGVTLDSQGFNIGVPQTLDDSGGGSLTKIGSGTLTLTGANTYAGTTTVSAGTLATTTASTGGGGYAVATGAELSVQVVGSLNSQLNALSLTLGSSATTLGIDLNTFGSPTAAPVNVTGELTANGTTTVNVASATPLAVGQYPLVQYGSETGAGSFVLGSLPPGDAGHLSNNIVNSSIDLVVSSAGAPRWNGTVNGVWDINTTANWIDIVTLGNTTYQDGNPVVFDDNATGTTAVNLGVTVTPSVVNFNNNSLPYTITGSGKIGGSTGLNINGSTNVSILNTGGNNFTGPVVISRGTLIVTNLANGGLPSAIGASSANPTNLVLAGGTLSYSGPAVSINRNFILQNTNSSIDTESSLALSGAATIAASGFDFTKTGPAQLTYLTAGINALSGSTSVGYRVANGTVLFNGSSGVQTNNVGGNLNIGGLNGGSAAVVVTNAILNVPSGALYIGQNGGAAGTLTIANGGVLNATAGNLDLGDGGGQASTGVVNQTGGTVNPTSQIWIGQNNSGVGIYNLSGGTFNFQNWLAVGRQGGTGTLNISGGVLYNAGNGSGYNFDIGTSGGNGGYAGSGTLNQTGGMITNTTCDTWLGEGTSGQNAVGVWNMSAGSAWLGSLKVGYSGIGTSTLDISGTAAITCNSFVSLGLNSGVTGNLNIGNAGVPGGSLTMNGTSDFNVGDGGTGVVTMVAGGGGQLTVPGTLYLTRGSSASGTVNLNGGTITVGSVNNGWGFGNNLTTNPQTFNFNGGTLKAHQNAAPFIQPFVNAVVQSGGAVINDSGYTISVNSVLTGGGSDGGLTKLGGGTLYLNAVNTYTNTTLVSAGTLGGVGTIAGPVTVASGATLAPGTAAIGTLTVNSLILSNSSSTYVKVSLDGGATNDQVTGLASVTYAGSLVVTNVGVTSLAGGGTFRLFNTASHSGNYGSVTILPSGSGSFNPVTGVLTIASAAPPTVNPPTVSGGNLILTGSGGTPLAGYTWLTTTNVANPVSTWTTNIQSSFDSFGAFSNAIPINQTNPEQFFRLRTP